MLLAKEMVVAIQEAIQATYHIDVPEKAIILQATRKEFTGSHTLIAFSLTSYLKENPATIATKIGKWLTQNIGWIAGYEVVKGFLNLQITDEKWLALLKEYQKHSTSYKPKRAKVAIEISCPNTNKPLHLGHLRNVFIGDAIANILAAVGYEVQRIQMINDRGIHICKSMVAYQHLGEGRTPDDEKLKGDHFVGKYYVTFEQVYQKEVKELTAKLGDIAVANKEAPIMQEVQKMLRAWEEGDREVLALWEKMNQWVYEGFDATYQRIGLAFDKNDYESDTYLLGKKIVQEGLAKGIFYAKEDQSIWVDLTDEDLGHKLLLRGDGTAVYITQDLGTADMRYQYFAFDQSIYVVGDEQKRHFQVLFTILKKLERPYASQLLHIAYGMVDLPTGKMKSREGTVVDADHLIDDMVALAKQHTLELGKTSGLSAKEASDLYEKIGLGALKYFLLKVNPSKRILFDPHSSIDLQGDTGPFIQYTYARIHALMRKSKVEKDSQEQPVPANLTLCPLERELLITLLSFDEALQEAATSYNPAIIADYAYQLCKIYSRLYAQLPILQEENNAYRRFRLQISQQTATIIKKTMALLNIEVPERM